jgi:hypothetical protein
MIEKQLDHCGDRYTAPRGPNPRINVDFVRNGYGDVFHDSHSGGGDWFSARPFIYRMRQASIIICKRIDIFLIYNELRTLLRQTMVFGW